MKKRSDIRILRRRSPNGSSQRIDPFVSSSITTLGGREVERRKRQGGKRGARNVQASASSEKSHPSLGDPEPERVGTDGPSSQLVATQTLHRQTSYASGSQETSVSVALTERQQELRERVESMRGGISALEAILLNKNIPEEQRRDAQAELRQLQLTMAWFSWMEQSDWARGLVNEPPPAYNTLLGR
jgi:hypothetical protein